MLTDKSASSGGVKNENILNQELAEELQKTIIRNFEKQKVHSSVLQNIWVADLADMKLMHTFNKGIRFLLCVIDFLSKYACVLRMGKYAWVIIQKGIRIINAF